MFGPAAMAHLALGAAARATSDFARGLLPTRPGPPDYGGMLVADAMHLIEHAHRVLAAAVIAAHADGVSWTDIAEGLGTDPDTARTRWTPTVQRWRADLARASSPGQHDDDELPDVLATPPTLLARELDRWVVRHREPDDPTHGEHPVTHALSTPGGSAAS